MKERIKDFFKEHEWLTLTFLVCVFILIRLPGVHLPLHQDEYKWPAIVNPSSASDVSIPHPPLSEFIYRTAGFIVGFNVNFRFVPLFFGTLNLLLLYYFMRMRFSKREAWIAGLIWTLSYFSVLASLMVDTDGQIMPFFFLLALIGYYKMMETSGNRRWWWIALLATGCVGGFFIKVSFLLAIAAIAADFLWSQKHKMSGRDLVRYAGFGALGLAVLALLLVVAHFIFPFFNLASSVSYWEHFASTSRDWFQTFIQCAKAFLYTSPFLVLVPFLSEKKNLSRVRPFLFFLLFAFIFYIVLFDFSLGALDRYLQLVILPLTVIVSVTITSLLAEMQTQSQFTGEVKKVNRTKEYVLLGLVVALCIFWVQFIPHYVPPLHPKSEWVSRVIHLKWNFLYPFSGGSGPLGFYISFLFMSLSWIVSLVAVAMAVFKPSRRAMALAFLLPIGLMYNGVFITEYLGGFINGSAPHLLSRAVDYIKNNPDIQKVTVYNDNGGNEIQQIGKYRKRLYVDPKFDINEKVATLNQYKEHYFVLDIPRIDPTSVYQKYFDSCKVVYKDTDKQISVTVYDCRGVPDLKI